jgi:hypothetical protein
MQAMNEHGSYFLIELPGSAWDHLVTLCFTRARVADVNTAGFSRSVRHRSVGSWWNIVNWAEVSKRFEA